MVGIPHRIHFLTVEFEIYLAVNVFRGRSGDMYWLGEFYAPEVFLGLVLVLRMELCHSWRFQEYG